MCANLGCEHKPAVPKRPSKKTLVWRGPELPRAQVNSLCVCVCSWWRIALTPVRRRFFEVPNHLVPPLTQLTGSKHCMHTSHAEAGSEARASALLWQVEGWREKKIKRAGKGESDAKDEEKHKSSKNNNNNNKKGKLTASTGEKALDN